MSIWSYEVKEKSVFLSGDKTDGELEAEDVIVISVVAVVLVDVEACIALLLVSRMPKERCEEVVGWAEGMKGIFEFWSLNYDSSR